MLCLSERAPIDIIWCLQIVSEAFSRQACSTVDTMTAYHQVRLRVNTSLSKNTFKKSSNLVSFEVRTGKWRRAEGETLISSGRKKVDEDDEVRIITGGAQSKIIIAKAVQQYEKSQESVSALVKCTRMYKPQYQRWWGYAGARGRSTRARRPSRRASPAAPCWATRPPRATASLWITCLLLCGTKYVFLVELPAKN